MITFDGHYVHVDLPALPSQRRSMWREWRERKQERVAGKSHVGFAELVSRELGGRVAGYQLPYEEDKVIFHMRPLVSRRLVLETITSVLDEYYGSLQSMVPRQHEAPDQATIDFLTELSRQPF